MLFHEVFKLVGPEATKYDASFCSYIRRRVKMALESRCPVVVNESGVYVWDVEGAVEIVMKMVVLRS